MQDFAIRLSDRPGELAQVAAMLARYGVNLKSLAALAMDGRATVHILPDEAEPARAALTKHAIVADDPEKARQALD